MGKVFCPLASFRIFSLSFLFWSFEYNMFSYSVWHLLGFTFSELPGSVASCLTLIWGKFSAIIPSNLASVWFCLFLLVFPLWYVTTFGIVPQFLDILPWICLPFSGGGCLFFSLLFTLGSFCYHTLELRDSLLSCVQSTNELHFSECFWSLAFLFHSF